jgi:hypothetical protein
VEIEAVHIRAVLILTLWPEYGKALYGFPFDLTTRSAMMSCVSTLGADTLEQRTGVILTFGRKSGVYKGKMV